MPHCLKIHLRKAELVHSLDSSWMKQYMGEDMNGITAITLRPPESAKQTVHVYYYYYLFLFFFFFFRVLPLFSNASCPLHDILQEMYLLSLCLLPVTLSWTLISFHVKVKCCSTALHCRIWALHCEHFTCRCKWKLQCVKVKNYFCVAASDRSAAHLAAMQTPTAEVIKTVGIVPLRNTLHPDNTQTKQNKNNHTEWTKIITNYKKHSKTLNCNTLFVLVCFSTACGVKLVNLSLNLSRFYFLQGFCYVVCM